MKALSNMSRLQVTSEYLLLLLKVYEAKGKEFYYDDLFERDKDVFLRKTIEQNVYYLAKILNLPLTDARLKLLTRKKMTSKNKSEFLVENIKSAMTVLQKHPKEFEVLPNEFDELARTLSKDFEPIKFGTFEGKPDLTLLAEKKKETNRVKLEAITNEYMKQGKTKQYEIIQMVVNFYIDFINHEIFTSQNDLISYIILYAFLIKEFSVFKYVSFFEYFYESFEKFKIELNQANYYYRTGYPNTDQLSKLIVDILNDAYETVNGLSKEYSFERKLNKGDSIEATIKTGKEIFSKEDIRQQHPTVSLITIDRTLKRLKEEGIVQPLGKGRSSKWQRIDDQRRKGGKQLDIFQLTDL